MNTLRRYENIQSVGYARQRDQVREVVILVAAACLDDARLSCSVLIMEFYVEEFARKVQGACFGEKRAHIVSVTVNVRDKR